MAKCVLLPMSARTSADVVEGAAFATCGRTEWKFELRVGYLAPGGSVTIVIDGSPDGGDDTWIQAGTFGVQSATGESDADTGDDGTAEITITTPMRYLRARTTAQVGDAVYEVVADAAFVSATDGDLEELLGKRAREYSQGLPRLLAQSEAAVLELLRPDPQTGALSVDTTSPILYDAIRRAICLQCEHLLEIDRLRKMTDASAKATLRMMGRYGGGVQDELRRFNASADMTWRHR